MLAEADIARMVRRIVERYGAIAVGTFGSYAIGAATERSDLDLFVIKDTPAAASARRTAVLRCLFGIMHRVDVHVFTPSEFEATVHEDLSFTWVIARQAKIYHWSDEAEHATPSLLARVTGGGHGRSV